MKLYIPILAMMMLILAGCAGGSGGTGNWRTFVGGTEGVEPTFEVDAPPADVIAGDPFFAVIVLNNLGEHTVPSGDYRVSLKGFSPAEFGGFGTDALTVRPNEDLVANSLDPDSGEILESYPIYVQIPENGELNYEGTIAGNTQFPFVAEVCYEYKTTANAQLCIKEDLQKPNDQDVCVINDVQAISSSGAPIQIIDFKEFAGGPDAVRFTFKVVAANTGGEVSELGSDCGTTHVYEDRVKVTVDTGLSSLPKCSGFIAAGSGTNEGTVKLSGGSRQVTCTQEISDSEKADYVKVVTIEAEYDYQQSVDTKLLVKPIIE